MATINIQTPAIFFTDCLKKEYLFFPVLILFLLLSPVSDAREYGRSSQDVINQSRELIQKNKLEQAEQILLRAIRQDKGNPKLRYSLGQVEEKEGEYSRAVRSYRYATSLDREYLDAYKAWANVELKHGSDDNAISPLGRIVRLEPDNLESLYQLGRIYTAKGSRKGHQYLESALKVDSNHRPSLEGMVAYYKRAGFPYKARKYEERLAALDGGYSPPVETAVRTNDRYSSKKKYGNSTKKYGSATKKYGKSSSDESVYAPYHGPKKTIAVLTFENKVKGSYGSREVGEGLTEMLTTELFKTGHFTLVERSALREIIKEQELGQTGLVRHGTAANVGQLAGAQFLVKGAVTEFKYNASGGGGALAFRGVNLGTKSQSAHVGIDIRIIDSSTGQIIDSYNARAKATSSGMKVGFSRNDLQFGAGGFKSTPLGKATRAAMQKAIGFILDKSRYITWEGAVIKAKRGVVYINRGSNANLKVGDHLILYSKGEDMIDPQTGMNLGGEETRVGRLTLTTVQDKFSKGKAVIEASGYRIKRGDLVQFR